jgi:hypothetical protein
MQLAPPGDCWRSYVLHIVDEMKNPARAQFSDRLALIIRAPRPFETVFAATVVAGLALLISSELGALFGLVAFEGMVGLW